MRASSRRMWLRVTLAVWVGVGSAAAQMAVEPGRRIDADALIGDLRLLSADDMEGRATGTAGNARARALLVERFRAAGLRPFGRGFEQPFAGHDGAVGGVNVIGWVEGSRAPGRYIVVSGHFDHIGVRQGRIFNGANDNASGAAALAALAGYFVRQRPATSMIFAAFDAEEAGLAGSRAFVREPPVDRSAVLVNVNLDMIGRDSTNTLYAVGTSGQPALQAVVDRVATSALVVLRRGYDDQTQGRDRDWTRDSDHWAFLEAGIPALYFGVEDFALHHDAEDEFDSMTLTFYVRAVETVLDVLEELDRDADRIAQPARSGGIVP